MISQQPNLSVNIVKFCGEFIEFTRNLRKKREAFLRRRQISIKARKKFLKLFKKLEKGILPLSNDWSDIPMQKINAKKFRVLLFPLMEVGIFETKAFIKLFDGEIKWPDGSNTKIKVEPILTIAGNTIYNAFVRVFGEAKFKGTVHSTDKNHLEILDEKGYTVLPPSGKFRDLIDQLRFYSGNLRCRIIQLLPNSSNPIDIC